MANDSKTLELQIRIATQEALKAVSSLKGEIQNLAGEAEKFAGSGGEELKDSFKEAGAASKDTVRGIDGIAGAIRSLAEVAALTKALSVIKDMGAFALQTADTFQTARNQFGTLLGDMEAGAGLFNEVKAFNDKTPFDLNTLTQATNVLIAAKVPLEDLQKQLTKFGDLSQGNSQKFTSYINAFSKASARGKADMEMLNTYLNQGVPILDALAKNFGVTTAEIVEMTSQGKVSFEDFSEALNELTAEGGMYFGGMELGSQSLSAMQEGLSESVNSLAASFGEMLMPAALAVVSVLTSITNAINESPILKGILAGALVMLTGYLAAMAVKATIAFASQMALNFSVGAINPVVMASTIAVAALATGYTIMASDAQKAARETENLALAQRKQSEATIDNLTAVQHYYRAAQGFDLNATLKQIELLEAEIEAQRETARQSGGTLASSDAMRNLITAIERFKQLRDNFINEYYDTSTAEKIRELESRISIAQTYMVTVDIEPEEKIQLESIISEARSEIEKLEGDINSAAREWKEEWAEVWGEFEAERANDPFYAIEVERRKKLEDAYENYVRTANQATLDEVNAYYDERRSEVIRGLADEEARIQRELTASKIDDLEYEMQMALQAIDTLEARRIIAAANSEEEIEAIRTRFAQMRENTEIQFGIRIEKTALEEAKSAVADFQTTLADNLSLALMNLEIFSDEAAVILGNLAAQFAELAVSQALTGFEEFGRALGEGKDAAESLQAALAAMAGQILKALPLMFLQAGLQLIANGQWALGLGFIAAAASSAFISGYVEGLSGTAQEEASANAKGGVYDEYGKAARAFASGGTFTNQIVSSPTYFRHGGGLGLMGEAGPEAIMPLKRMSNGDLGVEAGTGGGTQVVVNIINNTNTEVRKEEKTGADGNKQIDVIIGSLVNNHIASGKADRVIGSRYGLKAAGV